MPAHTSHISDVVWAAVIGGLFLLFGKVFDWAQAHWGKVETLTETREARLFARVAELEQRADERDVAFHARIDVLENENFGLRQQIITLDAEIAALKNNLIGSGEIPFIRSRKE